MPELTRTIDLPANLERDKDRYGGHLFRPAVLVERLHIWTGHSDGSARESYEVKVTGPRVKKDGGDHASAGGETHLSDIAHDVTYTRAVGGTQYETFLLGRDALRNLLRPRP